MLSLYEILKASKTGIAPDMWTALAGANFGGAGSGAETKELTGIPPLSIRSNGTMLLDYLISGNMSQTGTPTPTTPIQPSECGDLETVGDKAGQYKIPISSGGVNLWNEDYTEISPSIKYLPILVGDGTFTLSSTTPLPSNGAACLFFFSGSVDSGAGPQNRVYLNNPRTVDSIYGYVTIAYRITSYDPRDYTTMLNRGSTPLPYSPYNRTTTPIYLGEVPTTRKIKKLVLTGNESGYSDWKKSATYQGSFYAKVLSNMGTPKEVICSHAEYTSTISDSTYVYGKCGVDGTNPDRNLNLFIGEASWTVSDFKTYLQQQYANGTPVTVWYVLANETTGIVNKPLRKIGDYADTLSYEQAGVSVPTLHGNTVIDVETALKPSEMYIKYQE